DLVQALGVAVADFKQGNAVHQGVHPLNLIDGKLAHDVLVEAVLVVAADADLQVPDVVVQVRPGDRATELAVQAHGSLQEHWITAESPAGSAGPTAAPPPCRPARSPYPKKHRTP